MGILPIIKLVFPENVYNLVLINFRKLNTLEGL
jgi:hypothetical protein